MRNRARWWAATLLAGWVGLCAPHARSAPAEMEPWLFLPWDDGVGRIVGNESDSEGPKAFALTPEGGVLVLDQVNLRVLDIDAQGRLAGELPLPASTFDDLELWRGRAVLLLDRLVARTLLVMDRAGTPLLELDLEGRGIERSGMITALLPRSDGLWLEVAHRYSVKVLDADLQPCPRQIVLGRPVERGYSLIGAKDGHGGVTLRRVVRNRRTPTRGVTLTATDPVRRLVWLDEDGAGWVYAVTHEARFAPTTPYRVQREQYRLTVLDPQLHRVAEATSPWVLTLYDQPVEIRVGADGRLWQMAFTDDGVLLLRWDWRAP